MEWKRKAAVVLLVVLVGLAGCGIFGPNGQDVGEKGNAEAFVHGETNTICYYQQEAPEEGGTLDCVRSDSLPDSYPTVTELDQFTVFRDETADIVCYEWNRNGALSCLPTPEDNATEPSPTDEK